MPANEAEPPESDADPALLVAEGEPLDVPVAAATTLPVGVVPVLDPDAELLLTLNADAEFGAEVGAELVARFEAPSTEEAPRATLGATEAEDAIDA
jgi:hypothetical protein